MEININCDLGEKSKFHSNKHDTDLLKIVNSANIACGYHAGDEITMNQVIKISLLNPLKVILILIIIMKKKKVLTKSLNLKDFISEI